MRLVTLAIGAGLALGAVVAQAQAQATFGDTELSYQGGVVYDDDLVPGHSVDAPYLVDEAGRGAGTGDATEAVPPGTEALPRRGARVSSPNLVGPDGRLVRY